MAVRVKTLDVGRRLLADPEPKIDRALTPSKSHTDRDMTARMVAPSDSLPTRNEEYGTREYWCALMRQSCFLLNLFLNI